MKRLLLSLLVTAGLMASAAGQDAQTKPAGGKSAGSGPAANRPAAASKPKALLAGMHAEMARVVGLDEAKQKQIAQLNEQRAAALQEYDKANAEKLKAAQADLAKAREAKDKDAIKKAQEAVSAIQQPRAEIAAKSWKEMLAVLTPDQRDKWHQHLVMRTVKERYAKAQLTDEQLNAASAALAKLAAGLDLSDNKLRSDVTKKLSEQVQSTILTEPQKQAMKAAARGPATKAATTPAASAGSVKK